MLISDRMGAVLATLAKGKEAQLADQSPVLRVLGGRAVGLGLARTIRHRDHTRTLALTDAGRAALAEWRRAR